MRSAFVFGAALALFCAPAISQPHQQPSDVASKTVRNHGAAASTQVAHGAASASLCRFMGPGSAAAFTCSSGKGATDFTRGLRYLHEEPPHYKLSDQWFRKAAEQRCGEQCSMAALLLADAYGGGVGVPRNDRLALKWYKVAAKLALNPPAEVSIGDTYAGGWGNVPRNDKLAAKWYLRAFKQGSRLPFSELSKFYAEGLGGLAKNPVLACALHIAVVIGGFGEGGPPPESTQQRCASIDSHFTPEQLQRAKTLGHQLFESHS